MTLRIVFVLSPYQNAFFDELADALCRALDDIGVDQSITTSPGDHVIRDDDVFVLLPPHEYTALEGDAFVADEAVAARTIGISAEQPHQSFFERNAAVGALLGAVLDFSPRAVAAYQRLGVDARHLRFGHVPSWDRVAGRTGQRQVETSVLYLGNHRPRRLAELASAADQLSAAAARLVVSDPSEPNRTGDSGFFSGEAKRDLLATTGLVLNIHQSDEQYFEWLRFSEAAHCGAPMLTEMSTDTMPFVDGVHFLSFDHGGLAGALEAALADQGRLDDVADAAHERLVEHPLSASISVLVETATELLAHPAPGALPKRTRTEAIGRDRSSGSEHLPTRRSPSSSRFGDVGARLRRLARREEQGPVVIAPPGTTWRLPTSALVETADDAPLITVMASGVDDGGNDTLEGLWPWAPWRLGHGQHLGRVLIADRDLVADAERWLDDPRFDAVPHVRLQLYAVTHGIEVAHVPSPHAALAVAADPTQQIEADIAARCVEILGRQSA